MFVDISINIHHFLLQLDTLTRFLHRCLFEITDSFLIIVHDISGFVAILSNLGTNIVNVSFLITILTSISIQPSHLFGKPHKKLQIIDILLCQIVEHLVEHLAFSFSILIHQIYLLLIVGILHLFFQLKFLPDPQIVLFSLIA